MSWEISGAESGRALQQSELRVFPFDEGSVTLSLDANQRAVQVNGQAASHRWLGQSPDSNTPLYADSNSASNSLDLDRYLRLPGLDPPTTNLLAFAFFRMATPGMHLQASLLDISARTFYHHRRYSCAEPPGIAARVAPGSDGREVAIFRSNGDAFHHLLYASDTTMRPADKDRIESGWYIWQPAQADFATLAAWIAWGASYPDLFEAGGVRRYLASICEQLGHIQDAAQDAEKARTILAFPDDGNNYLGVDSFYGCPMRLIVMYHLACAEALIGNAATAMDLILHLEKLTESSAWHNWATVLAHDKDLNSLHALPAFCCLLARHGWDAGIMRKLRDLDRFQIALKQESWAEVVDYGHAYLGHVCAIPWNTKGTQDELKQGGVLRGVALGELHLGKLDAAMSTLLALERTGRYTDWMWIDLARNPDFQILWDSRQDYAELLARHGFDTTHRLLSDLWTRLDKAWEASDWQDVVATSHAYCAVPGSGTIDLQGFFHQPLPHLLTPISRILCARAFAEARLGHLDEAMNALLEIETTDGHNIRKWVRFLGLGEWDSLRERTDFQALVRRNAKKPKSVVKQGKLRVRN
ncbi:hypothetical protein HDU86_007979 [Geranomyces michiganensis]|nr:hypothetical protein HDU86_007979 [Geranomyces michiganensis]